jgi:hypothetical protein
MEDVQKKLEELSVVLKDVVPFRLAIYNPDEVELLDVNARYMRNDTFAQLVKNVKRDKGLSSVPLVYVFGRQKPLVISGNHRILAARAAKVPALCFAIDDEKTMDELVAIQLSHNSIAGADDLPTLKKLYDSIVELDMKAYSGLDEETIQQLNAIKFEPVSEPRLVFKTVTFLFLPHELDELKGMISHVEKILKDDLAYGFMVKDYQEFFTLLADAKEKINIRNSAAAILELMRAGTRQIDAEHPSAQAAAAGVNDGAPVQD